MITDLITHTCKSNSRRMTQLLRRAARWEACKPATPWECNNIGSIMGRSKPSKILQDETSDAICRRPGPLFTVLPRATAIRHSINPSPSFLVHQSLCHQPLSHSVTPSLHHSITLCISHSVIRPVSIVPCPPFFYRAHPLLSPLAVVLIGSHDL